MHSCEVKQAETFQEYIYFHIQFTELVFFLAIACIIVTANSITLSPMAYETAMITTMKCFMNRT